MKKYSSRQIDEYILNNIESHPSDISRITVEQFDISRQSIARHLRNLVDQGLISATGNTKARKYKLKPIIYESFKLDVTSNLEEDVVWRERVLPLVTGVPENVLSICQYGFTEMLNNVVSHADSKKVLIHIERNAINIHIMVSDYGVGIFKKIQTAFNYDDPRHALLELSKGKLTSDQKGHTGEGIFFTSRMFDNFQILSGDLFYSRTNTGDDWLIEVEERPHRVGTAIFMEIRPDMKRTMKGVFNQYTSGKDFGFTKTHVPIKLARYDTEQLVSRSQARRILARFERFEEVMLDFRDVETIGQAFADEIFRVYQREHPETKIYCVGLVPETKRMIKRVKSNAEQLPLNL